MMSNSIPSYALYGRPVDHHRLSAVADAPLAAASGEYLGRGNKCMGNDDTCGANRMKGQELCVGHYRQAVNLAELAEQIESEE